MPSGPLCPHARAVSSAPHTRGFNDCTKRCDDETGRCTKSRVEGTPVAPRAEWLTPFAPNRVKRDGALERPNSVRRRGFHLTFPSEVGQSHGATLRSLARLGRPSGKVLCSIIYSGMTCLCSAPQYQAEGREMFWHSPLLREDEGRESIFGSAGDMTVQNALFTSIELSVT